MKLEIKNPEIVKNLVLSKLSTGLQPALEKAKEIVESKFVQNPSGWVPLAAVTIQDRRSKGFGPGPMLYRTGHLQGVAVEELTVDSATEGHIGTADPIAMAQNNGSGNIPARPFYNLTDAEKQLIFTAFLNGIKW